MGWWITLGILALLAVLPLGVSVRYDADGPLVKVVAGPIRITLFPRPKKVKKPKKEKKPKNEKNLPKETTPEAKKEKKQNKPKNSASGKKSSKKKKKKSSQPAPKTEPVRPAVPAKAAKPAEQAAPADPAQSAPKKEQPAEAQEKPEKKGGSLLDFLPLVRIALDFLDSFRRKLRVNLLELTLTLAADDPCDLAVNYGRAWTALGNLLPRLERFLVIQRRDLDVRCDFTASKTTVYARLELTITLGRLLAAVFVFAFRALVAFIKIMIKRKGGTENEPKSS